MGKKTFNKPNIEVAPEMSFFSEETIKAVDKVEDTEPTTIPTGAKREAPEGYKVNPIYVEKRTKRVQLVLQPSLYDKVKQMADKQGVSLNDFCHKVLEEATEEI